MVWYAWALILLEAIASGGAVLLVGRQRKTGVYTAPEALGRIIGSLLVIWAIVSLAS